MKGCRLLTSQGMFTFIIITHIPGMTMIIGIGLIIPTIGDILDHILIIGGIRMDAGLPVGMSDFLITIIIGEDTLDIMIHIIDMDTDRAIRAELLPGDRLTDAQ
jgi:hypothetical protein